MSYNDENADWYNQGGDYKPYWAKEAGAWRGLGWAAGASTLAPSYAYGLYERGVRAGWWGGREGGEGWTYAGREQYFAGRQEARNLGQSQFWAGYYHSRYGQSYTEFQQFGGQRYEASKEYWQFQQRWSPASELFTGARLASFAAPEVWPLRAFGYGGMGFAQRAMGAEAVASYMRGLPEGQARYTSGWWMGQPMQWGDIIGESYGRWTVAQVAGWAGISAIRSGLRGGISAGLRGAAGTALGALGVSLMQPGLDILSQNLGAMYARERWGMAMQGDELSRVRSENMVGRASISVGIGWQMSGSAPERFMGDINRRQLGASTAMNVAAYFGGYELTTMVARRLGLPEQYVPAAGFVGGQLATIGGQALLDKFFQTGVGQRFFGATGIGGGAGMTSVLPSDWAGLSSRWPSVPPVTPSVKLEWRLNEQDVWLEISKMPKMRIGTDADIFTPENFRFTQIGEPWQPMRAQDMPMGGETQLARTQESDLPIEFGKRSTQLPGWKTVGTGLAVAGITMVTSFGVSWATQQLLEKAGATPFQQEVGATATGITASVLTPVALAHLGLGTATLGVSSLGFLSTLPATVLAFGWNAYVDDLYKKGQVDEAFMANWREGSSAANIGGAMAYERAELAREKYNLALPFASMAQEFGEKAGNMGDTISGLWGGISGMFRAASEVTKGPAAASTERSALYAMAFTGVETALTLGKVATEHIEKTFQAYQSAAWDKYMALTVEERYLLAGTEINPPGTPIGGFGGPTGFTDVGAIMQQNAIAAGTKYDANRAPIVESDWVRYERGKEILARQGTTIPSSVTSAIEPGLKMGVVDEGYLPSRTAITNAETEYKRDQYRYAQINNMRDTISWGAFVDPSMNNLSYEERNRVAGIMSRGLDVSYFAGQVTSGKMSLDVYDIMVKAISTGGGASFDKWEAMRLGGISEDEINREKYSQGIYEEMGYRRMEGMWIGAGERTPGEIRDIYQSWGEGAPSPRGTGSQDPNRQSWDERYPTAQHGFSRLVTRPTRVIAGERGAEVVTITPMASATAANKGESLSGDDVKVMVREMMREFVMPENYAILMARESKQEPFMAKNLRRARSARGA